MLLNPAMISDAKSAIGSLTSMRNISSVCPFTFASAMMISASVDG